MAAVSIPLHPVSIAEIRGLLERQNGTCLSVYLPTHRRAPDNTVDRPTYKQLVDSLRRRLLAERRAVEVERLLAPLEALRHDRGFWEHASEGLAVLATDGRADGFLLPRPVSPLALVSSRFHTLPLIRMACASEEFRLVVLTSRMARVYVGTLVEGRVSRFVPAALPASAGRLAAMGTIFRGDVVEEQTREPHRVLRLRTRWATVHGGFGGKRDELDHDTTTFLRHVDRSLATSPDARLPMVLAAGAPLASEFRRLSRHPDLLEEGIDKDLHLAPQCDLAAAAAAAMQATRQRRTAALLAAIDAERTHGLASVDLQEIGRAAATGRIATLVVEHDRREPGRYDRVTGDILPIAAEPPDGVDGEDVLAALAESVVLHRGEIIAVDRGDTPSANGVAALYRY